MERGRRERDCWNLGKSSKSRVMLKYLIKTKKLIYGAMQMYFGALYFLFHSAFHC